MLSGNILLKLSQLLGAFNSRALAGTKPVLYDWELRSGCDGASWTVFLLYGLPPPKDDAIEPVRVTTLI